MPTYSTIQRKRARVIGALFVSLVALGVPTFVLAAQSSTGFLEICKVADGPDVSGPFSFDVSGRVVSVPVGACSSALEFAAGQVTVTEQARPGTAVTAITASPSGRIVARDLSARSATLTVASGDVSNQTIVTFTNQSALGQLKVCKVAGTGVEVGTNFGFTVAGQALTLSAGPGPGGFCMTAGSFPVDTNVTVTERNVTNTSVSEITVQPPNRVAESPDLAARSVVVAIGRGVTEATFTNQAIPRGRIEVCKAADGPDVSGTFSFDVSGRAVSVPVGACSSAMDVSAGNVTVTEHAGPGTAVSDITTSPSAQLIGRDLPSRTATVAVPSGRISNQVIVTFTNQAVRGQLKVCKVAGPGVDVGTNFGFTVAGQRLSVPAGPGPGGFCAIAGTFPVGTDVTVHEAALPGTSVSDITVQPPDRVADTPDLGGRTVVTTIGTGVTEATFTNRSGAQSPPTTVTTPPSSVSPSTTAPASSGPVSTPTTTPSATTTVPGAVPPTTVPTGSTATTLPGGSPTTTTSAPRGPVPSTTTPASPTTLPAVVSSSTTTPRGATLPGAVPSSTTVPAAGIPTPGLTAPRAPSARVLGTQQSARLSRTGLNVWPMSLLAMSAVLAGALLVRGGRPGRTGRFRLLAAPGGPTSWHSRNPAVLARRPPSRETIPTPAETRHNAKPVVDDLELVLADPPIEPRRSP